MTTRTADEGPDERLPGRLQATYVPSVPGERIGRLALWGTADPASDARALGFEDGEMAELTTLVPRTARAYKRVALADVPALHLPPLSAARTLVTLDLDELPAWRRPGPSVAAWTAAARLGAELVAHGRMVPSAEVGASIPTARWRIATTAEPRIRQLADALPAAAHATATIGGVRTAHEVLLAFLDDLADGLARTDAGPGSGQVSPFVWALTSDHDRFPSSDPDGIVARLDDWAAPVRSRGHDPDARLCIRLSTPPPRAPDDEPDTADQAWRIDYLLQAVDDPSLLLDAADVWDDAGTVTLADRHLPHAQDALARGLGEAARLFPPLDPSLSEARPTSIDLTSADTAELLAHGAAALTSAGLGVQLPAELTASGRARLKARLRLGATSAAAPGQVAGHGFDQDALTAFRWEIAVGDDTLTADEFAELAAHKRSLVRFRGRWVHVDPNELTAMAAALTSDGHLAPATAMAAALSGEFDTDALGTVEVVADDAAAALVDRLAGASPPTPRLDGIQATLRPYQDRGVAWLQARADLGLGAVLADDMGLGKTLQSIALLSGRPGDRPHLVVCPASVVGNWERELARFAPHLDVTRHHGPDRATDPDGFPPGSVTVTSYGTMRSDADLMADIAWDLVVLDEAQAFKNHTTRTAKVVRSLDARVKLPMTGTPVENRLAELWAIMDVAVPGLLGLFTPFTREVATPIERWRDPEATERLRRLTAPFVLRRTKRDPDIAPDLPDKQEQTVPVTLTSEQATLYQAVIDELFPEEDGDDAEQLGEGIERRGRILKLLTALKQVCNHPAQYLGQRGPLPGRSGKLVRATELLGEVVDAGDRALVFTQYRRMGDLLTSHLAATLDIPEVPFLHGGTTLPRRDAMVESFQTDPAACPILVISLKAGGTGLNLTRATHVVHYDRWWNPAVEDQATDRAYRIGQDRTVFVHKLVTTGTLEERIAVMLEQKRALADAVVGSGEAWLTELADDDLRDLVRLDGSSMGIDDEVMS